jgi:hypothetical protein
VDRQIIVGHVMIHVMAWKLFMIVSASPAKQAQLVQDIARAL